MISAPPPTPDSTGESVATGPRVMLLHAGGGTLAMAAASAREVTPRGAAIRLPGAPSIVCGVVNVRGTLVPLVDLGRLLETAPASAAGWLVTLDLSGRRCAIAVDSLPVLRVADAPPAVRPAGSVFLSHEVSVAGTMLPLLDVDALADDLLLH